VDDTGSLGKDLEVKGEVDMVENLESSPRSGRGNTKRTVKLTPGEALEILTSALKACEEAGIRCGMDNLYDAGTVKAIIVLDGVRKSEWRLEVMK
jgi:hypothetical protein